MAKDIQLYDHTGAVKLFPKTHSELVITREGITVDETLDNLDSDITGINGKLTTINSTLDNHSDRIATLEENAVIKDGSITTSKLADHSVTWEKLGIDVRDDVNGLEDRIAELEENAVIKEGSITTEKLANGAVTTDKIRDLAITSTKIASESITNAHLTYCAVKAENLDTNSVFEDRIVDDAVTSNKIKNGSITTSKIADYTVTGAKLVDYCVTTDKIKDYNVTEAKIATGAVSKNKLAEDSVTSSKIKDHAVEWDKLSVPVQTEINSKAYQIDLEVFKEETYDSLTTLDSRITKNEGDIDYIENNYLKVIQLSEEEYEALDEYEFNVLYSITGIKSPFEDIENRISALEELVNGNT